jgi:hypothetical protein
MDVNVYDLPTQKDPLLVERTYCELLTAKRDGEYIPEEVLDWMDSANNWLMESK